MKTLIELTLIILFLGAITCSIIDIARHSSDAKQGMYQYYGGK